MNQESGVSLLGDIDLFGPDCFSFSLFLSHLSILLSLALALTLTAALLATTSGLLGLTLCLPFSHLVWPLG